MRRFIDLRNAYALLRGPAHRTLFLDLRNAYALLRGPAHRTLLLPPRRLAVLSRIAVLGLSLLLLAACPKRDPGPVAPTLTPKEVVAAAKGTIEQWRQAYEIRSVEALAKLYARDLDLVVVQEGTTFLGWSSVEAMLKDRIVRTGQIRIRLKDMQVISLAPDVASAFATMTRELTAADGVTTVTESGTLTLVLRKQRDGWLITSEHYSYKRS